MHRKEEALKKPSILGIQTRTQKMRVLPLNIAWGIWLARNLKLF